MAAHVGDHFFFRSRWLTDKTKNVIFASWSFAIFACFWWFRGMTFGYDGPMTQHWGLRWRKVCKIIVETTNEN